MFDKIRNQLGQFFFKNAMQLPVKLTGKEFLKYGSEKMYPNWSDVQITDQDHYTGYGYAAIRNRANAVARVASENIHTKVTGEDADFVHPYLKLIKESRFFSPYMFWSTTSTYLDLEGVYYLFVLRNKQKDLIGDIQYMRLLNPYQIRRVIDEDTLEVKSYVEARNGLVRTIQPHMIIPIRELNPFDNEEPYAMTDAAKDQQFTLKSASEYTRSTMRNNLNAPGILSTDLILPKEEFKNFMAAVKNHRKGEPLFSNGGGAITYEAMVSDLSKAALKDVNDTNVQSLLAVAGTSKTIIGVEQSGVTRETGKVQDKLYTENQILPRITLITDALNLDFKNNYPTEYEKNNALIMVDNPNKADHEAEKTEVDVRDKKLDLYGKLIDKGYSPDIAAKYAKGDMDIDELGKPTNKPKVVDPVIAKDTPPKDGKKKNVVDPIENKLGGEDQAIIAAQQSTLENAVINIEEQLVAEAITRVGTVKNAFDSETDVIGRLVKTGSINELEALLTSFWSIVYNIAGKETANERMREFGFLVDFRFTAEMRASILTNAERVSRSHIDTVSNDLYETVRKKALEGGGRDELVRFIKREYNGTITKVRAKTLARTETNRAFTQAQFDADSQFVKENGLKERSYKKWETRSSNPCAYCLQLASEPAIPFFDNFRDLGDTITVGKGKGKTALKVHFDALEAGNAHPNCSCIYKLIVRKEK